MNHDEPISEETARAYVSTLNERIEQFSVESIDAAERGDIDEAARKLDSAMAFRRIALRVERTIEGGELA